MKTLDLRSLEASVIKYRIIQFPDGEPHIVLDELNRKEPLRVICRVASSNDLFVLLQVGDILNRQGITFDLVITYLMSMRMDRVITFNESYSLKIVANLINSISPNRVYIVEPHSEKTCQLIHNSEALKIPLEITSPVVCFPDEGAAERYRTEYIYKGKTILYGLKKRDISTGQLLEFSIKNPFDYAGGDICIVDDLCDAGGTFIGLAAKLKAMAPDAKLNIAVTHMVNPKGIKNLSERFDAITFTDSYCDWSQHELPSNVRLDQIL